jgi:signal transduction histidine kinase
MEQLMNWMYGQAGTDGVERKRVEAVVETLAGIGARAESVSEVAHDARNMVTALALYCDLLEEPGVLAAPFAHYGGELRLVAEASRRLVEKLVALDANLDTNFDANSDTRPDTDSGIRFRLQSEGRRIPAAGWMQSSPIADLAAELMASRNLLSALAGPWISLTVNVEGAAMPVRMSSEDLTRVLVNLVKNAAEAMPTGGRIQIGLSEHPATAGAAESLHITISDNGPGIPGEIIDEVFTSGYTTHAGHPSANAAWSPAHRGLGLAIVRSIVESAGGHIAVSNRSQGGACFEIGLPVLRAGDKGARDRGIEISRSLPTEAAPARKY